MPPTYGLGVTSTPARNSDQFQPHGAQFRPSSLPQRPLDPTPNRPSLLRNSTLPTSGSPVKVELPSFSPAQGFQYCRMESPDLDNYDELYPTASQSRPGAFSVVKSNSYAHFASLNSSTPTTTTGKKRGRPFGKTPLSAASRPGTSTPTNGSETTKKRGRPFGKTPLSAASTPGTSTPINGLETTKKRGRPFGKTPLSAASTPGTSTPTNGSETTKKRGRPFGNSYGAAGSSFKKRGRPKVLQPDIEIPEPKFIAFLCEWKDCPAELQNLETLRLHLFNVHGKPQKSGATPCLWNKCWLKHADDQSMKFASGAKHLEFDNKEKWQNHMSKAHLIPIAWHLGDGPRGSTMDIPSTSLSPKSQPWLYDSEGRQVTPSVQNQRTEGGRARDNNARRFAKQQRGIYVVVGPVKNPEEYVKVSMDEDDEDGALQ